MLRVWALYNGSRRVMWVLIAVFAIGLPSAIAIRKVPPLVRSKLPNERVRLTRYSLAEHPTRHARYVE